MKQVESISAQLNRNLRELIDVPATDKLRLECTWVEQGIMHACMHFVFVHQAPRDVSCKNIDRRVETASTCGNYWWKE